MPKGFLAHDGLHPEFAELYGVQEHANPTYPARTYQNVAESDGTVRFAADFNNAGEKCTLKAIHHHWLTSNRIVVLNVAGNSERRCPGIAEFVTAFLAETIAILAPSRE